MSRARGLLAAGALAGLALATVTLVQGGSEAPPAPRAAGDPVAWIDGEPISQETFARFAGVSARSGGTLDLDGPQRRVLLDRLIDEELLLREGLAIGLPRNEPGIRRAIVSAVIDDVTTAPGEREPSRRELETLYAETRERWLQPGPVQAEAARVPVAAGSGATVDTEARARATEIATRARAGEPLGALAAELGAPLDRPLPASAVPVPVLREHLATPAVQALLALEPGAVSDPLRSAEGWWVVRLVARGEPQASPLDSLLAELREVWIRRQHDEHLRAHVAALRARAEIRVAEEDGG